MRRATTIGLSALAWFLFSGCTARSLSVLQAEFNAAVEARAKCQSTVAYEPKEASGCSVDYHTIFADIAAQTEQSLTDYEGGTAIKIGLHRLHAYSLWQSGAPEKAVAQTARNGLAACAGDNYAQAPRDCALLATIGSLMGVEAIGKEIGELYEDFMKTGDKRAACAQNAEAWRKTAADYWNNYYLPLAEDMSTFAAKAETPDSVLLYLQKQHAATFDQLNKLKEIGRQCVPDDAIAKQLIACPCNPHSRTSEDQGACETVFDPETPIYSFYFEVFCMSEHVFKSNYCPCGYENLANLTDRQQGACNFVRTNPDAKMLYETKCRLEDVLKEN